MMQMYQKRMRLFAFDYHVLDLPAQSLPTQHIQLQKKIDLLSKGQNKHVVLLKEQGKEYNSVQFSQYVQQNISQSLTLIFVIGAHQGFSETSLELYKDSFSLSRLTFPHQLVPLIFAEQLYRAETLVENKPYHY